MKLGTLLALGRVSNLPTVWTNVIAGAVVAGSAPFSAMLVGIVAGSLFYVGGMFLNDAFDAEIDARERPERPIPSGRASRKSVFTAGFGMLGLGLALLALYALLASATPEPLASEAPEPGPRGLAALLAGAATALAVVVYDRWHKGVAFAPLVMGACRAGLYVTAGFLAGASPMTLVLVAAATLALYVVGLTHVARFETRDTLGRLGPTLFVLAPSIVVGLALFRRPELWSVGPLLVWLGALAWVVFALSIAVRGGPGSIPRSVVSLIAGISLVDASFLAVYAGRTDLSLVCVLAFLLTLGLQRWVRGT